MRYLGTNYVPHTDIIDGAKEVLVPESTATNKHVAFKVGVLKAQVIYLCEQTGKGRMAKIVPVRTKSPLM